MKILTNLLTAFVWASLAVSILPSCRTLGGSEETVAKKILSTGGLAKGCSIIAEGDEISKALAINSQLSSLIDEDGRACRLAVSGLTSLDSNQHLRAVRAEERTAYDVQRQIVDLTVELDALLAEEQDFASSEPLNSSEQTSDSLEQTDFVQSASSKSNSDREQRRYRYESEIVRLRQFIDSLRQQLKGMGYQDDRAAWERKQAALYELPNIFGKYREAIGACRTQDPTLVAQIARSGLNLAVALQAATGPQVAALSFLAAMAAEVGQALQLNSPDKLIGQLEEATAPLAVICGIEMVAETFCASKEKLRSIDAANSQNCEIDSSFDALRTVSRLVRHVNRSANEKTWDRLNKQIGDVQTYLNAVAQDSTATSTSFSGRTKVQVDAIQTELRQSLPELKNGFAEVINALDRRDFGKAVDLLQKKNLMEKTAEVFEAHKSLLRHELLTEEGRFKHQSSQQRELQLLALFQADMFFHLDDMATILVTGMSNMKDDTSVAEKSLSNAILISEKNLQVFSRHIEKAGLSVPDVIANVRDGSGNVDPVVLRSKQTVARQLCAAALSLYPDPGSFPKELSDPKMCGKEKFLGIGFPELAKQHWDNRACIAVRDRSTISK